VATKSNGRTRVDFAPGRTDAYVIVQNDGKPYPFDQGMVYEGKEGLERAQRRSEWLNWSERSKQANVFHHPREEQAAKRAQQREALLQAHRALQEEERLGTAVAAQLRALRAELAREEAAAEEYEQKAQQEGRPAKVRREMRQIAKAARARAQGLAKKIAELEAGPAQPSRLRRDDPA
jgi:HrpA-like RNA helicase